MFFVQEEDGIRDLVRARGLGDVYKRQVVVTFDPHPQIVLAKQDREPLRLLTSIDERCELMEKAGIDLVVVIEFSKEFAAMSAEQFIRSVIVETIGVQHFFIGHDHSFGKDRGGNEELLQQLSLIHI